MSDNVPQQLVEEVTSIVKSVGKIPVLEPDQDYYDAGLASVASLTLLLDLEEKFGISLSDDDFVECRTTRALAELVGGLKA